MERVGCRTLCAGTPFTHPALLDTRAPRPAVHDFRGGRSRASVRFPLLLLRSNKRVAGIEPALPAWEAGALPLCYTRVAAIVQKRRPLHKGKT